jgi:hypothetical protein
VIISNQKKFSINGFVLPKFFNDFKDRSGFESVIKNRSEGREIVNIWKDSGNEFYWAGLVLMVLVLLLGDDGV